MTIERLVRLTLEADLSGVVLDPASVLREPTAAATWGWPDRRVMVTGGGGFLGKVVVERLEAAGVNQIVVPGSADWDTTKRDGQPRRALDRSRARERFGFDASAWFEEGLRRTIDWLEQHEGAAA